MNIIRDGRWGRRRPNSLPNSRFDDHHGDDVSPYKIEEMSEVKEAENIIRLMMISMMFPRSPLCTAAIVFYTCVCIPLGRLKKKHSEDAEVHDDGGYNITGVMFGSKEKEEEEICCPICLVEFEAEDAVTHLPRCSHLFHIHCMEPWLLRGCLTCPLCRSFVLAPTPSPRNDNNAPSSSTFYLSLFFIFGLFLHLLGYL